MRSVENAECRKCGVKKMRSVENEECTKSGVRKMKSVENEECRKCRVKKMRSVENVHYTPHLYTTLLIFHTAFSTLRTPHSHIPPNLEKLMKIRSSQCIVSRAMRWLTVTATIEN